jgi:hypothetical protein
MTRMRDGSCGQETSVHRQPAKTLLAHFAYSMNYDMISSGFKSQHETRVYRHPRR